MYILAVYLQEVFFYIRVNMEIYVDICINMYCINILCKSDVLLFCTTDEIINKVYFSLLEVMLFSTYLCLPLEGDTTSKPSLAPADGSDDL